MFPKYTQVKIFLFITFLFNQGCLLGNQFTFEKTFSEAKFVVVEIAVFGSHLQKKRKKIN